MNTEPMTNEQVNTMWEDSGRRARVQWLSESICQWCSCTEVPVWDKSTTYRIHPDDVHLCTTLGKVAYESSRAWTKWNDLSVIDKEDWELAAKAVIAHAEKSNPPGKYDYARKIIDAIESGETTQAFHSVEWVNDSSPIYRSLSALNDPRMVRIKPKTVKRKIFVYTCGGGIYEVFKNPPAAPEWKLILEIEVEEEQ